jgi:hypothetical protein
MPAVKRPAVDWEAIEREYRAGQLSVREISRQFGVSHVAIGKRIKDKRWVQDLAEKVRKEVTNRLVTSEVTKPGASARQIVEEAAERGVKVVFEHRAQIARGRKISSALFAELEANEDGTSLKDKSVILGNLAGSLKTFIGLERQAFNLSDEPSAIQNEAVSKKQRDAAVEAALRADS